MVLDVQPIWLHLDTRTLVQQFGYDRLRYFQPLKSIFAAGGVVGGGSDHMQKIGSFRSVNPYNPFLGMATAITRRAKWHEGQLHPEEALTREQALRFYTINNAQLLFKETRTGSLEPGKLADLLVLDADPLKDIQADVLAVRAGVMTMPEFTAAEAGMSRSQGTCMTMGTASTMACTVEVMGLSLPYNGTIPGVDARRAAVGAAGALLLRRWVTDDRTDPHQ